MKTLPTLQRNEFPMAIQRPRPGLLRPTTPPISLLAVALTVLVPACERSGPPGDEEGVIRRDSAGIEIVENRVPQHGQGRFWKIDPEPEIVIGGRGDGAGAGGDSGPLVWDVTGLARLDDGRVAVLSGGNRQLALFDASGRLVRTMGREGSGPGEFRSRPDDLQYFPPDTLVVWDSWFGPVVYFDAEGRLLRQRTLDLLRIMEGTGANAESPRVPLPDGSFVVLAAEEDPTFQPAPGSMFRLPPANAFRVDSGYAAFALGAWEGWEMWNPGPGVDALPFPYYYMLHSHIAGGGDPLLIYASEGDRDEIHQFAANGTLLRIIRRTTEPVPVTDRSREGWLRVAGAGDPEMRDPAILEAMSGRAFYPPVGALVVDTEGHLWVREWSRSESGMPDQWSVFGPDGRWLGVIPDAPPDIYPCMRLGSFRLGPPCWIGSDFFLTVRRDDLGVERVEGYRIRRETAGPSAGDSAAAADHAAAWFDRVPGDVFRDCDECPAMVVVPAGTFMMGTPDSMGFNRYDTDRPLHEVRLAAPFAVGRHEVTFAEWEYVRGSPGSWGALTGGWSGAAAGANRLRSVGQATAVGRRLGIGPALPGASGSPGASFRRRRGAWESLRADSAATPHAWVRLEGLCQISHCHGRAVTLWA